jgi:hypothetical protein
MKYPHLALACAVLFGAGCSLPFFSPPVEPEAASLGIAAETVEPRATTVASPTDNVVAPADEPQPVVVENGEVVMNEVLIKRFKEEYALQAGNREKQGLSPGSLFFVQASVAGVKGGDGDRLMLVKKMTDGFFSIIEQDIGNTIVEGLFGGNRNLFSLILEPKNSEEIFFLEGFDKDWQRIWSYRQTQKAFKELDGELLGGKVSPTEDRLLYIDDSLGYGKALRSVDLRLGRATVFGRLPTGYSYAQATYPPNNMGDGLRSKGDVSWVDPATVRAVVYSDKTDISNYPDSEPRAALKTITVDISQADVKL